MELTLLTLVSFPETTYPQHRCSERWSLAVRRLQAEGGRALGEKKYPAPREDKRREKKAIL